MMNETVKTMVANAEEVKEAIVDNMETVLNKYNWVYTRKALNKIYDRFLERKGSLINILSKHPKWNPEKLYIHFDADYTRSFDTDEVRDFENYIRNQLYGLSEEKFAEFIEHHKKTFENTANFYNYYSVYYPTMLFFDILENNLEESKVTKELEEKIAQYYPELKCKKGQKVSRLIGKYCRMCGFDKCEFYEKKFAKVADSLNPVTYTRHTVLSLNPVDYLMMSNGNTWASCHTIDVEDTEGRSENYSGCYCAGTLSYMLDECSMVFYTVDGKADGTDLELEYKVLRNMFHYQNNKLLQARLYPQCNDSNSSNELKANIRVIVQEIFAECLGINNLWKMTKNYGGSVITGDDACNYPDYFNFTCYMSYPSSMETLQNTGKAMEIGARPMCIECGREYCIDKENTINGCSGRPDEEDYVTCECCGERMYIEDANYSEEYGYYYCNDCCRWSELEETYIPENEAVEVITRSWNEWVSEDYARNCDDIARCDGCGEWYYIPDTEETGYCYDCESEMSRCDECGCLVPEESEEYHNGCVYCNECYEEILEQEKEEEESEANIEDEIELPLGVYENEIA